MTNVLQYYLRALASTTLENTVMQPNRKGEYKREKQEAKIYMMDYLEALDTNGHKGLESLKKECLDFTRSGWDI